jgi:hypothetical protein
MPHWVADVNEHVRVAEVTPSLSIMTSTGAKGAMIWKENLTVSADVFSTNNGVNGTVDKVTLLVSLEYRKHCPQVHEG